VPLEKLRTAFEDGAPISAVSNLWLLESKPNRAKRDLTYFQYQAMRENEGEIEPAQRETLVRQFGESALVTEDDLKFVEYPEFSLDEYRQFLINRFDRLKSEFIRLNVDY
jgi:hypothetical protein